MADNYYYYYYHQYYGGDDDDGSDAMPGHVKLGKPGEADPDPTPYLVISMEMKRADMLKPYDSKKSYWAPDGKGGYCESMLETDEGGKATVMCGHIVSSSSDSLAG